MPRTLALFALLAAFTASAQEETTAPPQPPAAAAEPPVSPPPVGLPPAPTEAVEGPKASDHVSKKRFSRFSAGPGGPLFAFAEGLDGLVLGALAGAGTATGGRLGTSGAFIGALLGGLVLGGGAAAVQYFHPIGFASAGTISLGLGVGVLAGYGIATAAVLTSFTWATLLALSVSQVGMLVPLIALWNVDDISGEDLALMSMTSAYAFVATALTTFLFTTIPGSTRTAAVLLAPAFGMALGALWALGPDLAPGRILKLTALPLGVGLVTFVLGIALTAFDLRITSAATLLTTAATFGLTWFLTSDEPATSPATPVALLPSVSMAPAGWRNEGVAVGPALMGRF